MRFQQTRLPGAFLIDLEERVDERGSFSRTFCEREFAAHGLPTHFPQRNMSRNLRAGTLRGMHYNVAPFEEAKVVRPFTGSIFDVIIDLRADSPTELQSLGVELRAETGQALFIPAGFAHGFITLKDDTSVWYEMGAFFEPEAARGFRWNDPKFDIAWPLKPSVITARDAGYPDFQGVEGRG